MEAFILLPILELLVDTEEVTEKASTSSQPSLLVSKSPSSSHYGFSAPVWQKLVRIILYLNSISVVVGFSFEKTNKNWLIKHSKRVCGICRPRFRDYRTRESLHDKPFTVCTVHSGRWLNDLQLFSLSFPAWRHEVNVKVAALLFPFVFRFFFKLLLKELPIQRRHKARQQEVTSQPFFFSPPVPFVPKKSYKLR